MRRLLAIAIAVLIGLPSVMPLFALGADADAGVPACCRRDGKHHCMMAGMAGPALGSGASAESSRHTGVTLAVVTERCPCGSRAMPGTPHRDWTIETSAAVFAGIVAHPSVAPRTESRRRISADRSRRKRGPPSKNS